MDKAEKRKFEGTTTDRDTRDSDDTFDKRRKVIGPSLPPPAAVEDEDGDNDDNSDSDDDFGPSLPPPEGALPAATASSGASLQGHSGRHESATTKSESKPQRDAWMLLPPSELDRGSRVDPTKLRNRKFQTGRAAGSSTSGGGMGVAWTETPEEKMKRLQDEAMGISSTPAMGDRGTHERDSQKSEAMRERIQKYNEQKRRETASPAGAQGKGEGEEAEDDPSSRAFDKEKDMALSSKLTHAQRRELINKASDFGSRFTKGKFL